MTRSRRWQSLAWACCLLAGVTTRAAPALAESSPQPITAVFDLEGKGLALEADALDRLADYLTGRIAELGCFRVVPRSQVKDRLVQQKTASYEACYDAGCQIELGRELAADKAIAAQVVRIGSRCAVTLTLLDLMRAATDAAATGTGGCTEDDVVDSLDTATRKLTTQWCKSAAGVTTVPSTAPAQETSQTTDVGVAPTATDLRALPEEPGPIQGPLPAEDDLMTLPADFPMLPMDAPVEMAVPRPVPGAPAGWIRLEPASYTCTVQNDALAVANGGKTQFKVALDVPLLVGRFEVTRRDWRRVFGHLPEGAPACADDCPVTKVNFFDAVAYCNARSKKDKLPECYEMSNCRGSRGEGGMQCAKVSMKSSQCSGYRLPTAGEWDFLAAIAHPKGLDAALLDHIAWHQGNGQRRLHPVGSLDQDSLGLHDLIGNAGEWVDPWAASKARPKDADIERNTLIPVRGGSAWTAFDNGGSVEDSKEFAEVPDASTGFRLVRTVP